jgi:hypothetical protein
MYFRILGEITHVETFAIGSSIRELARLRRLYGRGRWRKRKGIARVRLEVPVRPRKLTGEVVTDSTEEVLCIDISHCQ